MADLRIRFGRLVAAHRRRLGLTQEGLAERAGISVDMISKVEVGATGARFPMIERLAEALGVDPAELFTTDAVGDRKRIGQLQDVAARLACLSEPELTWMRGIIEAALSPRG